MEDMFPVRCYTCNSVLAHLHDEMVRTESSLEDLGVHRMCCRRMLLTHVDLVSHQVQFPNIDRVLDESGTTLLLSCDDVRTVECD